MKKSFYERNLFGLHLNQELEDFLRNANPWWSGKPMRALPKFRRWLFDHALQRLKSGLAPVTVLRGPRQVGKTTLQEQIIENLLCREKVNPKNIFRVQFDDIILLTRGLDIPILSLCYWFQEKVLKKTFNESVKEGFPVYIFFDEVQNLTDWSPQVKSLVDQYSVRVFLTGSSALRIEQGRDSLAGRISTLELGTLLLREITELQNFGRVAPMIVLNGLREFTQKDFWVSVKKNGEKYKEVRDKAFDLFSERGGYPVAQVRVDRPWGEVSDQLNETVIKRVIQHDLRIGERGRKRDQDLLEELFRLCCRYIGQSPGQSLFIPELRNALTANVGWNRVLAYLKFLNDTLLLKLIDPLEIRLKKKKGRPKICLCDHALRASWLQEIIPLSVQGLSKAPHLNDLAGHIAESALGYFLGSIPNLDVAWFPERGAEPEVDYIISVGEFRIPIEVKYRKHIDSHRDTIGLRSFIEKTVYNAPFGILVTLNDDVIVDDPRIIAMPLPSFLLLR